MGKFIQLAAIAMLTAGCGVAQATTALQFSTVALNAASIGKSFTIGFHGVSDGAGSAAQYSNISAAINYQVLSVDHVGSGSNIVSTWKFKATIANTSLHPMSSARLSTFGFSTAAGGATGNNPAFLNISSPAAETTLAADKAPIFNTMFVDNRRGLNFPNVAPPNGAAVRSVQVGFTQGTNDCCNGGGGGGLDMNNALRPPAAGKAYPVTETEFALAFTGPSNRAEIILHNFAVRFQSLTGTGQMVGNNAGTGALSGDSGVGIVTFVGGSQSGRVIDPVPEPSSWAMLIAGFGLVGATLRRRRRMTVAA